MKKYFEEYLITSTQCESQKILPDSDDVLPTSIINAKMSYCMENISYSRMDICKYIYLSTYISMQVSMNINVK